MVQGITHSQSHDLHLRRARTGPDNTHCRKCLKFLHQQGLQPDVASNRDAWRLLEPQWVQHWLPHTAVDPVPQNAFIVPATLWDVVQLKAVQGCMQGAASLFVVQRQPSMDWVCLRLDRAAGWVGLPLDAPEGAAKDWLQQILVTVAAAVPPFQWWVYVRMYVLSDSLMIQQSLQDFSPDHFVSLSSKPTPAILHVSSTLPPQWPGLVKAQAEAWPD